eukprot:34778-Chlamydomonas_euryale.AAC.1
MEGVRGSGYVTPGRWGSGGGGATPHPAVVRHAVGSAARLRRACVRVREGTRGWRRRRGVLRAAAGSVVS